MDSIWKKASREVLMALLFFLPVARRIRIERWLRGREEAGRLAEADVAVVSFGKSGRTWLRATLTFYWARVPMDRRPEFGGESRVYWRGQDPHLEACRTCHAEGMADPAQRSRWRAKRVGPDAAD